MLHIRFPKQRRPGESYSAKATATSADHALLGAGAGAECASFPVRFHFHFTGSGSRQIKTSAAGQPARKQQSFAAQVLVV